MELEEKIKECKTPLKYEKFKKYYLKNKYNNNLEKYGWIDGKQQWLFRFENGYGASVIKHLGSHGFEDDLFELAVIYFDGDDWIISYNTKITSNVIGYLNNDNVLEYLEKIKGLDEHGR